MVHDDLAAPATETKRLRRRASSAAATPANAALDQQPAAALGKTPAAHGATDDSPNDIADPFVGRSVRKKFVGAGVFDGVVASAHSTKQGSYIVAWTDGMQTTMRSSALGKCLVTLHM